MLKIKPLIIQFESWDEMVARTGKALEEAVLYGKKSIQPKYLQRWASVEAYQDFMSGQRYAILAAIYKHNPASVYQLAKILGRAQQNVARDCSLLAGHGFIRIRRSEGKRKATAPQLAFDYNAILVCMPCATYKVALDAAA